MIPKIIHQIWIGDQSKRPQQLMDSWARNHPDWEYRLWTDESQIIMDNWRQFNAAPELAGKADIWRYEILRNHGGIYVDADLESLLPIPDNLLMPDSFCCWENEYIVPGLMANTVLGCVPGSRIMQLMIDKIAGYSDADLNRGPAWQITGPQLLTDTVVQNTYNSMSILPSHYFLPTHHRGLTYQGHDPVYADHRWGSTNHTEYKY